MTIMLVDMIVALADKYSISEKKLAETIGIHNVSLSRIKKGKTQPEIEFIIKALQAYPRELSHVPLSVAFAPARTDQCGKHLVDLSNGHIFICYVKIKRVVLNLLTKIHKKLTDCWHKEAGIFI